MIIVLTGSNDFARVEYLRKITNDFIIKYDEFGLEKIDAEEISLDSLIDTVASSPLLTDRRMVVLLNISMNKEVSGSIDKLLKSVADTTDLVIEERKFDKRSSLYKVLKKHISIQEFKELDDRQLVDWLVEESATRGGRINRSNARFLVDRVGANQMMLSHEIDKLLNYSSDINRESIELLVYPTASSSIFDLLEAAFAGNKVKALELYDDQRKQQVEPQMIIGMIGWQLHVIAVAKFNQSKDANYIASKSRLNPYVIKKAMQVTDRLTEKELKSLVFRTLELDKRLKSESIDADDAVQSLLLTI